MHPNPDESFIPLSSRKLSANERPDLRVTVMSQPDAQLLAKLQPGSSSSGAAHACAGSPRVTLQREGNRVSAIRVHCDCGRIVELACVYEQPPTSEAAG